MLANVAALSVAGAKTKVTAVPMNELIVWEIKVVGSSSVVVKQGLVRVTENATVAAVTVEQFVSFTLRVAVYVLTLDIEFEASEMLPAVTVKNEYGSTIEYSIGPQRDEIPQVIETESDAKAKVCDTGARVTVLVIAGSELKPKEMTVAGQGS